MAEMTMREKVAREIHYAMATAGFVRLDSWPVSDPKQREWTYAIADAVLSAMREPTEAMIAAALPFRKGVGERGTRLWKAMIDAAQGETNP